MFGMKNKGIEVKLSDERLKPFTREQLQSLSREDLIVYAETQLQIRGFLEGYVAELEEKVIVIGGQYFRIKSKMFGRSSERSPRDRTGKKDSGPASLKAKATKLPSERYPDAEIIDKEIIHEDLPACKCCGETMEDSGMVETSEYLTVIPKKYAVVRQHRHKYRCAKCHGDIVTTPAIPRVVPGGSYSDEMIVDATLAKYCDLIPMERYCQMAKRQGFAGLPPHSLIQATFKLATFLDCVYERLRQDTLATRVLLADETPHRMLEGDEKTKWYLWGFLNLNGTSFYECHDTRSGEVASRVLLASNCEVLLTDVYSGYTRAVREANEARQAQGLSLIQMAYCNSHARREFRLSEHDNPPEAQFMIDAYKKIYKLEASAKGQSSQEILVARKEMVPLFEAMKTHAQHVAEGFSSKSQLGKAFHYFLKNYPGLTLFLTNHLVPIDNNPSERALRSHVVGRKTWYGTHSKEGAEVAAKHFTIVESCKLSGVNPRDYYKDAINRLHNSQPILTPTELLDTYRQQQAPESS